MWVCVDCAYAFEYGSAAVENAPSGWLERFEAAMVDEWALEIHLGDEVREFVRESCHFCRSPLAGWRYLACFELVTK